MAAHGEIFLDQLRKAHQADNFGVLTTSQFFARQMGRDEANVTSWDSFRERITPLAIFPLHNTDLECLVTPKSIPWGHEDINIYVGSESREICELDDFTDAEGEAFLGLNFEVAHRLINEFDYPGVQITVGFNRNDTSYGHHSVLKLHSHIRTAPGPVDVDRRQTVPWHSLDRFDKLAFIEPFSPLFHDFIADRLGQGALGQTAAGDLRAGIGYSAIDLAGDPATIFSELRDLYTDMKSEYASIASIFTDGAIDPATNRPVPRPQPERLRRLDAFLATRQDVYSAQSIKVLSYLAEHLRAAEQRDPNIVGDMSSTAMMYISRGFAGAISFSFEKDVDTIRVDFLPRVITTSTPTKTMMGEDKPTVIMRTDNPASAEDRLIARTYHKKVLDIIWRAGIGA